MYAAMKRIVTSQRGSWKWQDAYRISYYYPRCARDGRWIWTSCGMHNQSCKYSLPQLRRKGLDALSFGSIHNDLIDFDSNFPFHSYGLLPVVTPIQEN